MVVELPMIVINNTSTGQCGEKTMGFLLTRLMTFLVACLFLREPLLPLAHAQDVPPEPLSESSATPTPLDEDDAHQSLKNMVFDRCEEAKRFAPSLPSHQRREFIDYLEKLLTLKSSDLNFLIENQEIIPPRHIATPPLSSSIGGSLSSSSPIDELRGIGLSQSIEPRDDAATKECAVQLLLSLVPESFHLLPLLIELVEAHDTPNRLRAELQRSIPLFTKAMGTQAELGAFRPIFRRLLTLALLGNRSSDKAIFALRELSLAAMILELNATPDPSLSEVIIYLSRPSYGIKGYPTDFFREQLAREYPLLPPETQAEVSPVLLEPTPSSILITILNRLTNARPRFTSDPLDDTSDGSISERSPLPFSFLLLHAGNRSSHFLKAACNYISDNIHSYHASPSALIYKEELERLVFLDQQCLSKAAERLVCEETCRTALLVGPIPPRLLPLAASISPNGYPLLHQITDTLYEGSEENRTYGLQALAGLTIPQDKKLSVVLRALKSIDTKLNRNSEERRGTLPLDAQVSISTLQAQKRQILLSVARNLDSYAAAGSTPPKELLPYLLDSWKEAYEMSRSRSSHSEDLLTLRAVLKRYQPALSAEIISQLSTDP